MLFVSYVIMYRYGNHIEQEFKSMILDDVNEPWEQEALEELAVRICDLEKEMVGFDTGNVTIINFRGRSGN